MTELTNQAPPVLVPVEMQKSQPTAAYLQLQKDAVYQMWVELQRLAALSPAIETGKVVNAYRSVVIADTMTTADYTVDANGTFTVTLPTADSIQGQIFVVKNSGTGTITLDANSTETIDGNLTITITAKQAYTVQSNGTNWIIV